MNNTPTPDRQRAEDKAEQSMDNKTKSTDKWRYQPYGKAFLIVSPTFGGYFDVQAESVAKEICERFNTLSVYQSATEESVDMEVNNFLHQHADNAAEANPKLYELLRLARAADQNEIEKLKKQIPECMQHCTIVFKECEKGHGELTATNWTQHDCLVCEITALQSRVVELEAERDRWKLLSNNLMNSSASEFDESLNRKPDLRGENPPPHHSMD